MRPTVENDMFRPIRTRRPLALALALALLLPAVAHSQCQISGDSSLCNGPVQLCGPDGQYEYMWIDPAGQFLFDRCIMATTPGTYMLRMTDSFGNAYGPCSKDVEATPPPPCTISGATSGCLGTPVKLCGPEGQFTFAWSGPNGFGSSAACIEATVEGTYHLSVWNSGNNCPPSTCDQLVTFTQCDTGPPSPPPPPPPPPPDAPPNCPRPAWFWLRQCVVSEHAEMRFDPQTFAQIAAAVDAGAAIFSWQDARDGFCATLHARPAGLRANAKRQFAAVHANVCAGELGIVGPGGRMIKLDRTAQFQMRGISTTVGDWLAATDARLAQLDGLTRLGREAREEYRRIVTVGWLMNHGCGIGKVCGSRSIDADRAVVESFADDPEEPLAAALADETDDAPMRAQGTPNPFSAATTVTYMVSGSSAQNVAIAVYDIAGRKLRDLAVGPQTPGVHELRWDGRGADGTLVRSGVYFVRGMIGTQRVAGQLTFLR
jgi:flagellar hook capping protein FlgD